MRKPVAVLISDTHYSLSTYKIADKAWRMAVDKAAQLRVPLIDAGDLTNDKAIIRAEVANTLIETMLYAQDKGVRVFCLVGNHSLINEKGEENALHFLMPYCTVVSTPTTVGGFNFIPYQTSTAKFLDALGKFPKGDIVIGHQGTKGGAMGDYIQDHSAFDADSAKAYKVFLGHYHQHYTLGTTVSIGNPYTLTFGEAKDPPKGFLVLYSDGSFERVLTNLRRHRILTRSYSEIQDMLLRAEPFFGEDLSYDLIWLKVSGSKSELDKLDKVKLGLALFSHSNYKLDKIYTESEPVADPQVKMTDSETMDWIIDQTTEGQDQKAYLKALYRELMA